MQLYEVLSTQVVEWRKKGYSHDKYPAIAEILEWALQPDVPNFRLRAPQLRALETYWCVIRSKATTDSGACRPLFGDDRNRWTAWSGITRGEVTLDNLLEMWQSTSGIIPGGSDVTGKVIHAKDQRSTAFEMVLRFIEPCHWAQLPDPLNALLSAFRVGTRPGRQVGRIANDENNSA